MIVMAETLVLMLVPVLVQWMENLLGFSMVIMKVL